MIISQVIFFYGYLASKNLKLIEPLETWGAKLLLYGVLAPEEHHFKKACFLFLYMLAFNIELQYDPASKSKIVGL